jgi:antitoxin (DNA-binding transcriptional repressor) of toxin-antitoxin stability system
MKFISIRDLRQNSRQVWKNLKENSNLVVTSNGKPIALLSSIEEEDLELQLKALRRARAEMAVNKIQQRAKEKGLDTLSQSSIEEEIKSVRQRRSK